MTTNTKQRRSVYLDPASLGALKIISAALQSQGAQGGVSSAIRYAALKVAKGFQTDL